jgi:hypothetical protein
MKLVGELAISGRGSQIEVCLDPRILELVKSCTKVFSLLVYIMKVRE